MHLPERNTWQGLALQRSQSDPNFEQCTEIDPVAYAKNCLFRKGLQCLLLATKQGMLGLPISEAYL